MVLVLLCSPLGKALGGRPEDDPIHPSGKPRLKIFQGPKSAPHLDRDSEPDNCCHNIEMFGATRKCSIKIDDVEAGRPLPYPPHGDGDRVLRVDDLPAGISLKEANHPAFAYVDGGDDFHALARALGAFGGKPTIVVTKFRRIRWPTGPLFSG